MEAAPEWYETDILSEASLRASQGLDIVLHYHLEGHDLSALKVDTFSDTSQMVEWLRSRVKDYHYDDSTLSLIHRIHDADSLHGWSKRVYRFFSVPQYHAIKRILGFP